MVGGDHLNKTPRVGEVRIGREEVGREVHSRAARTLDIS